VSAKQAVGASPDDSAATARAAGLRYVSDADPGIRRRRKGKGFEYLDAQGRRVGDRHTLARIRALAIPPALRSAAGAGIGLLLTFLGLRNTGIIVGDPATLVRMGTLDYRAAFLLLGILIAAFLVRRKNPLAFLAAIFTVTALAWVLGYARPPDQFLSAPDFSTTFLALDIRGALKLALLPTVVAIFFTDLFDSLSTFIGVSAAAGLTGADGRPINLRRGLIVDAIATLGSGTSGTGIGPVAGNVPEVLRVAAAGAGAVDARAAAALVRLTPHLAQ